MKQNNLLTKALLLLAMIVGSVNAWADPTATMINQSTGAVNTTDFKTTLSSKEGEYTCGTHGTFSRYIQMGGAVATPIEAYQQDRVIRYDALTNSVTVDVYAYNKANSDYKLYVSMIEEGDEAAKDIDIQEFTVSNKSGNKFSRTFTPTTNASIYIHVGNNSNVFICQAEVTDNGATTLKQGGEIGYTANLSLCRLANNKTLTSMDGIEYNATSNSIKVLTSGNPVKLKATSEYIKFTISETEKVSINASGSYYSVTKNDTYQSGSAVSGNQNIILDAGTYYICPNGSNVSFASLSFSAPPSLYTVTYNLNGGTGTTPEESDKAEGAKFTLHNGTTGITAPTGMEFSKWKDQDANEYNGGAEFTMPGKNVTLTAQWINLKCAKPTVTIGDFNFENKKYVISVTNNEAGSTLKVSTDGGSSWSDATTSYDVTSTATYKFKSVKDSYDDSDVATASITHDSSKKNIAWVRQNETYTDSEVTYSFADDGMVSALSENYNVVDMPIASSTSITSSHDIKNADLIVLSEAVGGGTNLAKGMKNFIGVTPMINLKVWASTTASGRWGWATATNVDGSGIITPSSTSYKFLSGVSFTGSDINMFDGTTGRIQVLTWSSEPTDNVDLGTNGEKVAMHAIINDAKLDKQFFAMGVCCNYRTQYSVNTKTIIKNVAAILIAGTERLDAEVATVSATVGANGYTTFACSYPLDLTDANRPEGLKAYKATRDGANLTFKALNQTVPAGTGLLLLGETKGGDYTIPVVASGTAVDGNALVGVTTPTAKKSVADDTYYFVMKKAANAESALEFLPLSTSSEVTIPAGKAYIEVPNGDFTSSHELTFTFEDATEGDVTGIAEVSNKKAFTGEFYNLNGQKVSQPTKGLYIVNGRKVIVK